MNGDFLLAPMPQADRTNPMDQFQIKLNSKVHAVVLKVFQERNNFILLTITGKQAVGAANRLKKKFKTHASLDFSKMRLSDRKDRHRPSKSKAAHDEAEIKKHLQDLEKVKRRAKKRRRSEASRYNFDISYFFHMCI